MLYTNCDYSKRMFFCRKAIKVQTFILFKRMPFTDSESVFCRELTHVYKNVRANKHHLNLTLKESDIPNSF